MKQLESMEEAEQVFVGNIDCNISAASGDLIAFKRKHFSPESYRMSKAYSLAP
jgi:hypothetical protein